MDLYQGSTRVIFPCSSFFHGIETVNNDYTAVTYDNVSPTQHIKDLYISLLMSHRHFYSHAASINVYINKHIYLSAKVLLDFEVFARLV